MYFFPDVLLIVEGARVGALDYAQLKLLWSTTIFVEDGAVPRDAEIVGHTWRFVNKNGGPDRRFNNNRQLPEARYLQMQLSGAEGLRKILHLSKVVDHTGFDAALDGLRRVIGQPHPPGLDHSISAAPASVNLPSPTSFVVSNDAKKIETEKPKFWEYKLTAALLRDNVGPVLDQAKRLQEGGYSSALGRIGSLQEVLDWCNARMDEVVTLSADFGRLVNDRMPASWGPAGQPGDVAAIERVCEDLTDCAQRVVAWKETVRFTKLPSAFADVQSMLTTFPDSFLVQIGRISTELERVFGQENPSGKYSIQLVVTVPDRWSKDFNAALKTAARTMGVT